MTLEFCLQGVAVPSTVMINASIRCSSSHLPFCLFEVSYHSCLFEVIRPFWLNDHAKETVFLPKVEIFPSYRSQIFWRLSIVYCRWRVWDMHVTCCYLYFKSHHETFGLLSFGYRLITWARSCNLPSQMPIKGTWGRKKETVSKSGQWRLKLSLFWNY